MVQQQYKIQVQLLKIQLLLSATQQNLAVIAASTTEHTTEKENYRTKDSTGHTSPGPNKLIQYTTLVISNKP